MVHIAYSSEAQYTNKEWVFSRESLPDDMTPNLRSAPLLRFLQSLVDRFSVVGLVVFVVGTLLCLSYAWSLGVSVLPPQEELAALSSPILTSWVCLWIMFSCSLAFLLIKSPVVFRALVFVKVLAFLLHLATAQGFGIRDLGLVSVFLVEIALYEAFWVNMLVGAAVVLLTQTVQTWAGPPGSAANRTMEPLLAQGDSFLLLILVLVVSCLFVYYRESCIALGGRLGHQEEVIGRLTEANMGYQLYARESAVKSQLEERQRITRDLHDIIGYTFTNNIMMMEAAITKIRKEPERVANLIDMARDNAQMGYEKIREALYHLRSVELTKTSTYQKLRKLIDVFRFATQVKVEFDYGTMDQELPEDWEGFAYSFVQESLTNAFLHGRANLIEVRFFRSFNGMTISVRDNGVGAGSIKEGIGLAGMSERARILGGTLEVRRFEKGFELAAFLPVARPQPSTGEERMDP